MAVVHERGATAVAAHLVERLDEGNPYFLILFGKQGSEGTIIAVDALLEYWFNFCDIQRLGGCSQSWLVRPDDNILSSIEVQEAAYTTFGSTPAGNPAKIRGVYLLRVGLGNTPWTLLSRLEPATLP